MKTIYEARLLNRHSELSENVRNQLFRSDFSLSNRSSTCDAEEAAPHRNA